MYMAHDLLLMLADKLHTKQGPHLKWAHDLVLIPSDEVDLGSVRELVSEVLDSCAVAAAQQVIIHVDVWVHWALHQLFHLNHRKPKSIQ